MSRSIKKRTQQNTFQNQSVVNDLFSPQPPQILDDSQQLNPNQEEDDNEYEKTSFLETIKNNIALIMCVALLACVIALLVILSNMSKYLAQSLSIQQKQNEAIQQLISAQQEQNTAIVRWARKYFETEVYEDDVINAFNGTDEELKYAIFKAFNTLEKDSTTGNPVKDWTTLSRALQQKRADDQWKKACDTITKYGQINRY